jgi:hypothetical protein
MEAPADEVSTGARSGTRCNLAKTDQEHQEAHVLFLQEQIKGIIIIKFYTAGTCCYTPN